MDILIVHKNETYRKKLIDKLKLLIPGCGIITYSNAVFALEYIKTKGVDAMFCEVAAEGVNGFRLLRELKEINRFAYGAMIAENDQFAMEAMRCRVNDYILEPDTDIEDNFVNWQERYYARAQ